MLDTLALGHRVEIAPGSVILVDKVTDEMRIFFSVADAWDWASARVESTYPSRPLPLLELDEMP